MNKELLSKFKALARVTAGVKSDVDFPFTKAHLSFLKTEEQQEKFLINLLEKADSLSKVVFNNPDENAVMFFAAYLFVYERPYTNFIKPDFYDFSLDDRAPLEINEIENENVAYGLVETMRSVKSSAAFWFAWGFALGMNGTKYESKKQTFHADDMLAKIQAPFVVDEVGSCKKFMIFDSRRNADQARIFLMDVEMGHIEALVMKNPKGTSYEYDDNIMAYGRVRGTTIFKSFNKDKMTFNFESHDKSFTIDLNDVEKTTALEEKLALCEKYVFI